MGIFVKICITVYLQYTKTIYVTTKWHIPAWRAGRALRNNTWQDKLGHRESCTRAWWQKAYISVLNVAILDIMMIQQARISSKRPKIVWNCQNWWKKLKWARFGRNCSSWVRRRRDGGAKIHIFSQFFLEIFFVPRTILNMSVNFYVHPTNISADLVWFNCCMAIYTVKIRLIGA